MNLIPNHEVPTIPEDVLIGWDLIMEYDSNGLNFLDPILLDLKPGNKRRKEHISSRKLFSSLLAEMKLDSNSVELKKMELGKPYGIVDEEVIHTSFSHSADWVVCAMSLKLDVGIDCEPLSREVNPRIFDRILNSNEKELLEVLSPLAIWTIKEAVVKCIGTGIRTSLQKYAIRKLNDEFVVDWEDDQIKIVPFVVHDHQLALAWRE